MSGSSRSEVKQPTWLHGLLSLIFPGLGQAWRRDTMRAAGIFLAVATALAIAIWYHWRTGQTFWYVFVALLHAWNVWDAMRVKGAPIFLAALPWLVIAYGIGWQATEVDPMALVENWERSSSILRSLTRPDFLARNTESFEGWVSVEVPCSTEPPLAERMNANGIHIRVSPNCAAPRETLIVVVDGLWPDHPTQLTWHTPIGDTQLLGGDNFNQMLVIQSDTEGHLTALIQVPARALTAAPDPNAPNLHKVYVSQQRELPGITFSENGRYVVQGIYETLAMALLTTVVGAVLALPFAFLAARNLMSGNPITMTIYVIVRSFLNITRSIEALIVAFIFVVIVGLGPFPGVLAMIVHTVAALGKLYSEVIEGIDPGPIEAVRATGASWLQTILYAVVPQIIPTFTALTIYRWDINIRTATIIGFVGGGGIGFFLWQWIIKQDYRAISSAFIAIVILVTIMDFFSARVRERLV
ncbi:MAG: phosphonate ABC transporter, permease protein PhnE [Anaerolineales bacterium]|nr:phosphonate ABC transporter, permease protein PhnE [Anaerolineales bacterium]